MPETLEDLVMMQPPTPDRPLLGAIVLVVEDSRHACEAMRLICQRSGARIRRAESLASAERHLRTYRPRLAVVDLGLPDGSGLALIEQLAQSEARIDGLIATSGNEALKDAALKAGADAFLAKPLVSVAQFQKTALALMPPGFRHIPVTATPSDTVQPDAMALRDDLALAAELLHASANRATIEYVAGFLDGLAKCSHRPSIWALSNRLWALASQGPDPKALNDIAQTIEKEAAAFEPV